MNLSSSQLCTEQWGMWAADTAQHPELHKQGRKPSEQRNREWNKREKDFLGELLQALTFQELAELRLLLQPGLEVEELPVAAVHGVISHLLEAARGLALQGCLILRRKAKAQSLHILKQSWSLLAPQSPGPTHVPPSNSSHQPFPKDEGTHHDRTKAGYKRFDQLHRTLQESLCHYQTATVPGIPPDKIYCGDTHTEQVLSSKHQPRRWQGSGKGGDCQGSPYLDGVQGVGVEAGAAVLPGSDGAGYPQVLDDDRPLGAAQGLEAEGAHGSCWGG